MKKVFGFYLGRIIANGLLLLLQLIIIIGGCGFICMHFRWIFFIIYIISLITALKIAVQKCNIPCRIGWIIGVLTLPILFLPLYYLYGSGRILKKIEKYMKSNKFPVENNQRFSAPHHISKQFAGLSKISGYPVYSGGKCRYFPSGESFFKSLKKDLLSAEKFIFLEFFIIKPGKMWDETLSILKQKAKEGVKIYILYDDLGTIAILPKNFKEQMRSYGITARNFNAFSGIITPAINYRDHRKIVSIDGKTGYTGGANIADEYINIIKPYGYWKDTAVRVEGKGAESFTAMFIRMWNLKEKTLDYNDFTTNCTSTELAENNEGIVMPFGDYPMCNVGFSEKAFLNMINNANKQIDITTPYLVPDSRLVSALCLASENGVRVRLFTPEIPDKKYIHIVTRANYIPLLRSNVEIYEFSEGFIHAKSLICDNEIAYIGSANLDYRSLYIHFESGVLTYKTEAVNQLSEDIDNILNRSKRISSDDPRIVKADKNIIYRILRLFSGLL
ncbi:MAG: phosphatidylserine/phosphatidylglycerophosphate/cardiolipin synthase family protein [Oscillospiraceae bacterium]